MPTRSPPTPPRVTTTPAAPGTEKLVDGDPATAFAFPRGAGVGKKPLTVQIDLKEPLTARTLQITPSEEAFGADCELQAAGADGSFKTLRTFKCDRSNMAQGVGFMPRGPVTIAFPPTTAKAFRLIFTGFQGRGKRAELAEINLSGAARLESFVEKQLGQDAPGAAADVGRLPVADASRTRERQARHPHPAKCAT